MADPNYDPAKRRERYLRDRQLKGRKRGAASTPGGSARRAGSPPSKAKRERIGRLTTKLASLTKALQEAQEALRNKQKAEKQSSDGKTTAKERQASKEYREKHKTEIASKRRKEATTEKSGGTGGGTGGGTKTSSKKSVSSMSVSELEDRISKIKQTISDTKALLQKARQ